MGDPVAATQDARDVELAGDGLLRAVDILRRAEGGGAAQQAFDGMHAQYEHSPPTSSASTITVVIPPCTVRSAMFSPTAPAPITMTSYSRSLIPSR